MSAELVPSLIRDIADAGIGQPDVIPLWFGEGCWPSPDIAVEAARRALRDADHFYQPNSGKPELREEISAYHRRIYGIDIDPRRITVTASGMQALALVAQALVDPGDRAVVIGPIWPNIRETLRISGAVVVDHTLRPAGGADRGPLAGRAEPSPRPCSVPRNRAGREVWGPLGLQLAAPAEPAHQGDHQRGYHQELHDSSVPRAAASSGGAPDVSSAPVGCVP